MEKFRISHSWYDSTKCDTVDEKLEFDNINDVINFIYNNKHKDHEVIDVYYCNKCIASIE